MRAAFLVVPMMRIIVLGGLYFGSSYLCKLAYGISKGEGSFIAGFHDKDYSIWRCRLETTI